MKIVRVPPFLKALIGAKLGELMKLTRSTVSHGNELHEDGGGGHILGNAGCWAHNTSF